MSQNNQFKDFRDKMYLNIFTNHPHESIRPFLRKYVPQLYNIYDRSNSGHWKALPPPSVMPTYEVRVHSFEFKNHPFEKIKIKKGHLDFFTKEIDEKVSGILDVNLWFDFDSYEDANMAFDQLIDSVSAFSLNKKIYNENNSKVAEFTENLPGISNQSVQFVLLHNDAIRPKYQIFFRLGIDKL